MSRFDLLVSELENDYKTFKIIPKDKSILMKIVYYTLFMFFWNKSFMEDYTTTIISRVYMPQNIIGTDKGWMVLRHEKVHIDDAWRWCIVPFVVSYLFMLPAGLTIRAIWEKRAYYESLVAYYELYGQIPDSLLDSIEEQFTSSMYLWMLPFKKHIREWLREAKMAIIIAYPRGIA